MLTSAAKKLLAKLYEILSTQQFVSKNSGRCCSLSFAPRWLADSRPCNQKLAPKAIRGAVSGVGCGTIC